MMIPRHAVHGDERYLSLDHAACEERALAERVSAVTVAHFGRFAIDVEGLSDLLTGEEREGPLVVLVAIDERQFLLAAELVEGTQHLAAIGESFERKLCLFAEAFDCELRCVGIGLENERIRPGAEVRGVM